MQINCTLRKVTVFLSGYFDGLQIIRHKKTEHKEKHWKNPEVSSGLELGFGISFSGRLEFSQHLSYHERHLSNSR